MTDCNCKSVAPLMILLLIPIILIADQDRSNSANTTPVKPVDYNKMFSDGVNYYLSYGYVGLIFTLLLIFAIDYKLYQRRMYAPIVLSGLFSIMIVMAFTGGFTHLNLTPTNLALIQENFTK